MTGKTITRVELCDAVHRKTGLSRSECMGLVELVLQQIAGPLAKGENVKLSTFGTFIVRRKDERPGRNPKTGTEVPISPRRVVVFKASAILKQQVNGERASAATRDTTATRDETNAPSL